MPLSWPVLVGLKWAQLDHLVTVQVVFAREVSIGGEATLDALDEGEMLAGPGVEAPGKWRLKNDGTRWDKKTHPEHQNK